MCAVTLHSPGVAAVEPQMLGVVIARCAQYEHCSKVDVFPTSREESGWLEWLITFHHLSGGSLTVGAIQRHKDGPFEFHS